MHLQSLLKGEAKKTSLNFRQSFSLISPATNIETWLKAGMYFIWKVRSIAPSIVQKHFCTISQSRDISKSKFDIRFQNFNLLAYLVSWNLMSHIVLLIFWPHYVVKNGFELGACLRMSPLKWDMSQPSKMFIARDC